MKPSTRTSAENFYSISEPERYESPLHAKTIGEESLLYVLRSMHVQAVAAQVIARERG